MHVCAYVCVRIVIRLCIIAALSISGMCALCCNVLLCVAVWCGVLQSAAECCSVDNCYRKYLCDTCSVLQCEVMYCSALQRAAACCSVFCSAYLLPHIQTAHAYAHGVCHVLQCVVVCRSSTLTCKAVSCSVLRCTAMCSIQGSCEV